MAANLATEQVFPRFVFQYGGDRWRLLGARSQHSATKTPGATDRVENSLWRHSGGSQWRPSERRQTPGGKMLHYINTETGFH